MRILAITSLYPRPGREHIAAFNRQQFRALAEKHELHLVAPVPWHEKLKEQARRKKVPKKYHNGEGVLVYHPTYYYPPRLLPSRYGECYLRSIRATLRRVVREVRPDVILACWAHPDGWAAVRFGAEVNIPVVVKIIGTDVLVLGQRRSRRRRIVEALCGADGVAAVSDDLAKRAVRLGCDPDRVHVVRGGVDTALFHAGDQGQARDRLGLPADEKLILFVGNLLVSKGVVLLVEACGLLAARGIAFRCCIVGQGRDESKVRRLIERHRLGAQVQLIGVQRHASLPAWYRACDIFALPSYSEGIPNVLHEALACGRPFVATDVGGIPEIAHPSYSRLIRAGRADELAVALEEMLRSPLNVDSALVQRCNVSWQDSAKCLAELLAATIAGHRGSVRLQRADESYTSLVDANE